ncbi:hypothetical protein DSO57_1020952, partial [Entomophthora muscae]
SCHASLHFGGGAGVNHLSLDRDDPEPLQTPVRLPPAPTCMPWLLAGLALMGLNAYFLHLSPVSSLWSPLQVAIPVLHWAASWWFISLGWEPNLVSLAPCGETHHQLVSGILIVVECFLTK